MIECIADVAPFLTHRFFGWAISSRTGFPRVAHSPMTGHDKHLRLAGQAYRRSQFHHGLVEIAGTLAAEQRFGSLPDSFPCEISSEDASQHAFNISVHDGRRRIEHDAGDGRGRVAADAGQSTQFSESSQEIFRHAPSR